MRIITNVCDACGKEYRPYKSLADITDDISVDFNAITLVKIMRDGQMHGKGKIELCPDCLADVTNFLFRDLLHNDAPFSKRLVDYNQKIKEKQAAYSSEQEEE